MALYRFGPDDVFVSSVKTYPSTNFLIYSGSYYYNSKITSSGSFSNPIRNVPQGHISLYELNVDRNSAETGFIYPFIIKESSLDNLSSVATGSFDEAEYGGLITGSYPLSASITRTFYPPYTGDSLPVPDTTASYRPHVMALKNATNSYLNLSPQYQYSASSENILGGWNKDTQDINLINIPSIFYGSSIKKGSVELKFYVSGSVIGHLVDTYENGELIQYSSSFSGKDGQCAGVVLYDEGIILLTGSWDLSRHDEEYLNTSTQYRPRWTYFGATGSAAYDFLKESSYTLDFKGVEKVPNITMLAHAPKNKLNNSTNPTFVEKNDYTVSFATSSMNYKEYDELEIKNIVKSPYTNYTASFQREVYISEIGIYDEEENLIAIAKLANPIKKTEEKDYTFKLKVDI